MTPAGSAWRWNPGRSSLTQALRADVILDDFRRASLFAGISDAQLGKLGDIARPVTLPAGASVFSQGDPADAFYLLVEGAVKVAKTSRDGRGATIRCESRGLPGLSRTRCEPRGRAVCSGQLCG